MSSSDKKVVVSSSRYGKLEEYDIFDGNLHSHITIERVENEVVPIYKLETLKWDKATYAIIDEVKNQLLKRIHISNQEALNIKMAEQLKLKFIEQGKEIVGEYIPHLKDEMVDTIARKIAQEMLGLGDIEFLIRDTHIEEICINGAGVPVWIYHRKYGWMKTNIIIENDNQIWNYASSIARGVGRQINIHNPLLDAYLATGDRVNATLFPISYFGHTITIRKFARIPWTITDYIKSNTISSEVAALLWQAIQYEINMIVAGGTGAGKTSLLNVLTMFIPQNQRVISIEQTREITLPSHLQWVPLIVREGTSEGTGNVTMLDLMVNSLRMRPDRIIVGEIRRAEEAQVLFEAMHTGHSVYATLHAETVNETINRLINPPINIPPIMLEALHLIVAMYRDRRRNIRRVLEVGEVLQSNEGSTRANIIYRWRPVKDEIMQFEQSVRLVEVIKTYANIDNETLNQELAEKRKILDWMVKNNINSIDAVGKIIASYYDDPDSALKKVEAK